MIIPESKWEYHRKCGRESGYPPCCIEAFLQGRDGDNLHTEYSIDWDDHEAQEKKIFGKVLGYVPCKNCCEILATGESDVA